MGLSLFRGSLILPDAVWADGLLATENGDIVYAGPHQEAPFKDLTSAVVVDEGYIAPGYVDIHVHGGAGADYMDGTLDSFVAANRVHARHGTTTLFPTTTTGKPEQIRRMLQASLEARESWQPDKGAKIGGVHYYGPYFAANKVGCHSVDGRRDPRPEEYLADFNLGIIQVATCAAELPGAQAFYREAVERGYLVTCGQSNATWSQMKAGFETGMRHVDHFWCAMSSISGLRQEHGFPMQRSMEQFVLMEQDMSTEVIADGQHLSPELLEFGFRMIGPDRLCLVTDANRAMGMPPGKYRFGPQEDGAWFERDGKVGFVSKDALASSVVGMDTMVRNMHSQTSAKLHEAVRMGSLTPARRAGLGDRVGSLEAGKQADFPILDPELQVKQTYLAGTRFQS